MESNVVEVQFVYAPRVNGFAVIVSIDNDIDIQMSLNELKEQYPMLCDGLSQMFSTEPDNPDWVESEYPWTAQDECCYGTLHNAGDECNCGEMNEEICGSQLEYENELAYRNKAIDENWSEEDKLKLQALREKIANQ
jgi:hypothetical protein